MKEIVTLRKKPMKDGGQSLFLDYSVNGKRKKEYLKLYLVPERTKLDRLNNRQTMETALAIKAKRALDIHGGRYGYLVTGNDRLLSEYLRTESERYRAGGHDEYAKIITNVTKMVEKCLPHVTLRCLEKGDIVVFVNHMETVGLGHGTQGLYYGVMATLVRNACRRNLMAENPFDKMETSEKPHRHEGTREYLTMEELQRMIDTPVKCEAVRQMFLFSCFTGLRLSDVERLAWEDIRHSSGGWQIEIRQRKTGRVVYIPLSNNAISFLPERGKGLVWKGGDYRNNIRYGLPRWAEKAGVTKHVTFHVARHTFATLMLTYGADLYTVSKLLGHSSIATTQIYAKIVDEKKRQAVDLIPEIAH